MFIDTFPLCSSTDNLPTDIFAEKSNHWINLRFACWCFFQNDFVNFHSQRHWPSIFLFYSPQKFHYSRKMNQFAECRSPFKNKKNQYACISIFWTVAIVSECSPCTYSCSNNRIWIRSEWRWPLFADFYFRLRLSTLNSFDLAFCEWFCAFYCFRCQNYNRSHFICLTMLDVYAYASAFSNI